MMNGIGVSMSNDFTANMSTAQQRVLLSYQTVYLLLVQLVCRRLS